MDFKMKAFWGILSLTSLAMTACGPQSRPHRHIPAALASTTGAANSEGIPYITTDPRMEEALKATLPPVESEKTEKDSALLEPIPLPAEPIAIQPEEAKSTEAKTPALAAAPVAATPKTLKVLSERLREFEISRFNAATDKPSRFGNKQASIKIFFTDQATLEFKGELSGTDGHYKFESTNSHYILSGTLEDKAPQRSEGDFTLTDKISNSSTRILYQAYKAKLTVRRDREKAPATGSEADQRLKELEDQSFGWVNNWAVVHGRSFYLVDIVKVVSANAKEASNAPLFAFKGESLRTGDKEHPVEVVTPGFAEDIKLMGNSEEEGLRIVSAEIEDPSNKEKYEFMLDIEEEKADQPKIEKAVLQKDEEDLSDPTLDGLAEAAASADTTAAESPQTAANTEETVTSNESTPEPGDSRKEKPALKSSLSFDGSSYLRVNTRLPRTSRMVKDFARNRGLPGVQKQIAAFRGSQRLSNFYYYAFPLRGLMEAIGEAYDVSPSYAYLTVIESAYLTGGRYNNRQKGDYSKTRGEYLAYGPFQFHPESARESGLRVTKGSDDERYYFAPSACAAARYMMTLADQFRNSDMTLAILAYNQGGTGAQRLARRYGYSFVRMSRSSLIPGAIRQYVEKKLAVYFISNNMSAYGYDIRRYANRHSPPKNTVMPPRAIHDSTCRAVVNSTYSI